MYVDPGLPAVSKSDFRTSAESKPVHLLYEFRTKGAANATATKETRTIVVDAINESGLFSSVTDTADASAPARLKIVIDNVPLTDNVVGKGVGTGLTFGLAGNMVTDGYVCIVSQTNGNATDEVLVKHAIHTTIGNHGGPDNLTPVPPKQAITTVINQMVLTALKELDEKQAPAGAN